MSNNIDNFRQKLGGAVGAVRRSVPEIVMLLIIALVALAAFLPPSTTPVSPLPTATPPANSAVFILPVDKIKSDLGVLTPGNVILIVVNTVSTAKDQTVTYQAARHPAVLLDILDKGGAPVQLPYTEAATVRVSLSRTGADADIVDFVQQLPTATDIYLLPTP